MTGLLIGVINSVPVSSVSAQKKGDRVKVLAGSAMRTAPGGQVVGVLSRVFEGPVEMVQGGAVRLRIKGFVSEQSVRLDANKARGVVGGARDNGGTLRTGPSEKDPALATLQRGTVLFSGPRSAAFLPVNRSVWVDKSRLAKFTSASTAKPSKPAAKASQVREAKTPEKPVAAPVAKLDTPTTTQSEIEDLSAADLRADPRGTKGRLVYWTVEALSYQLGDDLRRELNGQAYLLARGPGKERAMLYLAVPDSLIGAARALAPLTTVTITARIRTGRSEPGGAPILDLLELKRR